MMAGRECHSIFKNAGYGGYDYREEKGVAVSKSGDVVNIGNVSSDDWLCYTLQVTEAGAYSIDTYCVTANGKSAFILKSMVGLPARL